MKERGYNVRAEKVYYAYITIDGQICGLDGLPTQDPNQMALFTNPPDKTTFKKDSHEYQLHRVLDIEYIKREVKPL